MRRQAGRGAILATVTLFVAPLHAEPLPAARLAFTHGRGAERCPDEAALRASVVARLGYDPFRDDAPRSITARVEQAGGALRGEVTLTDTAGRTTGTRRLAATHDDCDELVAAMALAISIAVDPEVLFRPAPPPVPERAPEPRPPAPAPTPERPRGPPPRPPAILPEPLPAALRAPPPASRVHFHAELGGLLAAGDAPAPSGGLTAQLGLRFDAFSAAIEARTDLPATKTASSGGTVSARLLAASLVPCFHAGAFAVCALGTVGALRGVGAGVPDARTGVTPFAALGARVGVEVPLVGIVSADLHGDLAATLTHTALQLEGRDVWITPRAAGLLGAGVLVHFP